MKLIKGDEIIVTIGKDRGKKGKIEKVFTKEQKVLIPGVNEAKRHKKARLANDKSEIITITRPMTIAKVTLLCPKCHKPTRVGYKIEKEKKIRICRKCKGVV